MAVTFMTGPMDNHRAHMNQNRGGTRTKPRKADRHSNAAQSKPSNNYVARIVRSTQELSESIKYISYVIAYSAVGSSSETSKDTGLSVMNKRTNSIKPTKSQNSTIPRPPSSARDPFGNGQPLYPVTHDGRLRDVYVNHCVERVLESGNHEQGWHRGRLTEWFGRHLDLQIYSEDAPQDFHAHFLAAVELHKRMSADPRIKHRDGLRDDTEELWRDVVDALNNGVKMAKPAIMHDAGDPTCTLDKFMEDFDRVVKDERWNRKRLVMFQSPTAPRWPQPAEGQKK